MSTYSPSELQWSQNVFYFSYIFVQQADFGSCHWLKILMLQFLFLRETYLLLTLTSLWRTIGQHLIMINSVPRRNSIVILTALFLLERLKKLQGWVLVSISSEEFVDRLVDSSPCKFLLVVHDSLLMLAGIKEKYDLVKCWQGETIYVPEKWAPLDDVFLYFLPALPFKLDEILGSLVKKCFLGGRVVISHPQGREVLKRQRQEHPEVVVSDLHDKTTLQRVAAAHSYNVAEFVDERGLYLAVLSRSAA